MGLLMGQAGLFSLAHPTWFGLGAYIPGILSARGLIPPFPSIFVGAICVAFIAYVVGAPVLRLRGFYLACATFAIIIIAQVAAAQLTRLTGGPEGRFSFQNRSALLLFVLGPMSGLLPVLFKPY
jgi:branched-chain amino acid transport system permease protein